MKTKLLALLLCLVLAFGAVLPLVSCSTADEEGDPSTNPGTTPGGKNPDALVLMSEELDGLFNPFFSTTAADGTIVAMTQISMLTMDYVNGEVEVAFGKDEPVVTLDYESLYDATSDKTTYTFVIKNGIKFSDGVPLTIEDVLFNLYVYLDPVYTGSSTMYSTDIEGLANYRAQKYLTEDSSDDEYVTSLSNTYAKARMDELKNLYIQVADPDRDGSYDADYETMKAAILAHNPSSYYKQAVSANPAEVTSEQLLLDYDKALKLFREELMRDYKAAQDAYDTTTEPYSDERWKPYFEDPIFRFMCYEGKVNIEYEKLHNGRPDKTKIKDITKQYREDIATMEEAVDYVYEATYTSAFDQILTYWATAEELRTEYAAAAKDIILKGNVSEDGLEIPTITGIKSLGHNTDKTEVKVNGNTYKIARDHNEDGTPKNADEYDVLTITINGVDPKAVWNFAFSVAPHHYYAPGYEVDVKNNKFGVEWSSHSFMTTVVQSERNNSIPMGAGAYVATDSANRDNPAASEFYKNNVVYFKASKNFFFATPKIEKVRYQVVSANNAIGALESGNVHFISPQFTDLNMQQLTALKPNGIVTTSTDQLGYGYIGVSAKNVPDVNLRKAIMCAMNTSLSLEYYTDGTAETIYYPMSTVSWAYPKDANGNPDRVNGLEYPAVNFNREAAKTAILSYMQAAGVSQGHSDLEITFTIAGSNAKDHPTYKTFLYAKDLLEECGWSITVIADSQALTKLSTGSLEVWAAAWGSTVDPDLYQVYHKNSNATSTKAWGYDAIKADPNSEEYRILNELSDKIDDARETLDKESRKRIYKECLELILKLAVELPVYQRDVLYAYDSTVIKTSSLPSEINPYSSPLDRIWEIEFAN